MSKEVSRHEQLTFDFDEEYPSLLEPLQKKEKELGGSSPDLTPLKLKLINFYFLKQDVNNVYRYLKSVIESVYFSKDGDLSYSKCLEQLSSQATFVDKNVPGAGMVDRLDEIIRQKILHQEERKTEVLNHVVISLKSEHISICLEKDDLNNAQEAETKELARK